MSIVLFESGEVVCSGISDPDVPLDESQDAHRVLIDDQDRIGNVDQISGLIRQGYRGPFSFECTEPALHTQHHLANALKRSMDYLTDSAAA